MNQPKVFPIVLFVLICTGLSRESYGDDYSRPTREEIEVCQSEVKDFHTARYPKERADDDAKWAQWTANPSLEYKLRLHKPERDSMLAAEHDLYEFMRDGKMIQVSRQGLIKEVAEIKKSAKAWPALFDQRQKARLCLAEARLAKLTGKSPGEKK
jgi:hypothetical protein